VLLHRNKILRRQRTGSVDLSGLPKGKAQVDVSKPDDEADEKDREEEEPQPKLKNWLTDPPTKTELEHRSWR
jgi:hypothetical protein